MRLHLLCQQVRHVRVERQENLRRCFGEMHGQSALHEVFRHLDADETTAHDDGLRALAEADSRLLHSLGIFHRADGMDGFLLDAGNRRDERMRSGREQKLVVVLRHRLSVLRANGNLVAIRCNGRHFALRPHIERKHRPQPFRRLHEQAVLLLDDAASIIRQAAIRKRHMAAALDEHDVRRFIETAQTRCRRRTSSHAADNDILFLHFAKSPSCIFSSEDAFLLHTSCVSVPIGQ